MCGIRDAVKAMPFARPRRSKINYRISYINSRPTHPALKIISSYYLIIAASAIVIIFFWFNGISKKTKAAGLTHLKTGMALVSYTGSDLPAIAQIELIKGTWCIASCACLDTAQHGTILAYLKAAAQGA